MSSLSMMAPREFGLPQHSFYFVRSVTGSISRQLWQRTGPDPQCRSPMREGNSIQRGLLNLSGLHTRPSQHSQWINALSLSCGLEQPDP